MLLKWVVLLPLSLAAICPLERHQVCNIVDKDDDGSEQNKHRCTCAITALSDRPPPEQSCSNFIKIDEEDGTFPVTSITFNLKESPDLDEFPEESFRDTIAAALRVDQVRQTVSCISYFDLTAEASLFIRFNPMCASHRVTVVWVR
ncbi:hypothetical protein OESDEN_03840 [Oesophagostomum dentatum]|uniref:Uncharacterized protein n=1 Tax=Oesophagostomum dentatum TaxID=61180 RepID=A0A0B1TJE4_OESDE|nr:hypothetical protein OESDEN_03840 [Oesophagostomum dentatum]